MKLSERLFKLADYCEAQGPDTFHFGSWVTQGDKVQGCGTVCCLLGHSPGAFADAPEWQHLWFTSSDGFVGFNNQAAESLLGDEGMTTNEFHCAFFPFSQSNFWDDGTVSLRADCTLVDALANLRRLAQHIQDDGR